MKNFENPFEWFENWYVQNMKTSTSSSSPTNIDPTAMCLSTCSLDNRPSSRMVLLKKHSQTHGFTFYTNYSSQKAIELIENPNASLNFYWGSRQVRISGVVDKTSAADSDAYFKSRSRGSRIGAIVSSQSKPLESREELERKVGDKEKEMEMMEIERPDEWGGFALVPYYFEFWEEMPCRLHHRTCFKREIGDCKWTMQLLYP